MIIEAHDTIEDSKVFCHIIDLNEFVHANENKNVFVEDEHGNQYSTAKRNLIFDKIVD